ncbi:type III-D CRISPR-associated protein Csx19 [Candidatus Viridilinea mediisalina]|uniref:type III-D CRISPR-associated protein Csx19 n=1 Tax=Candidatus Viridilinea mediisalina TaxID=2024553 RepID=UPI0013FD8B39|nr:CRISPR-associated protein Csx19 [Candidatus Viridilinea mediisalina]
MKRELKTNQRTTRRDVALSDADDLRAWLTAQAVQHGLRWLLAHADNGIIWGEVREGQLKLASEALGLQELRLARATLQQARLFGPNGELRLWQGPKGLQAHLCHDEPDESHTTPSYFDETYLLWGTHRERSNDGFSLLLEGAQGIRHTPPLAFNPNEDTQRAKLLVRHYVKADATGVVRVVASRLVELQPPG